MRDLREKTSSSQIWNQIHSNTTLSHAEIQMSDVQLDLNGLPIKLDISYYPR